MNNEKKSALDSSKAVASNMLYTNKNINITKQNNYSIFDYINTSALSQDDDHIITRIDTELKAKFVPKKELTLPLSDCYKRIGEIKRSVNVRQCGTFLEWHDSKLSMANFCRDRLCPMCSWRRSYKLFSQVSKVMNRIESHFDFVFLTLTIPNVKGHCLSAKIDQMQKAFKQMFQKDKRLQSVCNGYFKALEVTHNKNRRSKSFDTYHPHFHVILAMDKDYCKSDNYIKQSEFLNMWRRVMKDNSITQVDVRMCKNKLSSECQKAERSLASAVSEVAKYSVKSSDYIIPWSEPLTDSSVKTFLGALSGRRLCSFGGIFRQVRNALQLDDIENGDLVHIDDDNIRSDVSLLITRFNWSQGVYKLISVEKEKKGGEDLGN